MRTDIKETIDRIQVFDDSPELCLWIKNYREDMGVGGEVAETRYYLEEIRQNLTGMNEILQTIKKYYRCTEDRETLSERMKMLLINDDEEQSIYDKGVKDCIAVIMSA